MLWYHLLATNLLSLLPFILAAPTSTVPVVNHPTSLPHGPYTGTPTVSGALNATSIGPGISSLGIPPAATTYPSDGKLHDAEPGPYIPAGGVGTNGTTPVYNAKSDFDYESLVGIEQLRLRRFMLTIPRPLRCTKSTSSWTYSMMDWRVSRTPISPRRV